MQNDHIALDHARRPEERLLLLFLKREPSADALEQIQAILNDSPDWTYFFDRAREQAVFPLVYQKLSAVHPQSIPPALQTQLDHEFKRVVQHNLLLTHELIRLLDLFEQEGIEALPYKGPIWAVELYQNLAASVFFDLDILVHPQDVLPAKELLVSQGYHPEHRMTRFQERWKLLVDCEYQMDHPRTGVHVEIHWRIVPGYIRFPLDIRGVWRRSGSVLLNSRDLPSLSAEDTLAVLCVHHGAKHLWSDLQSLVDLDRFLGRHDALDWTHALKRAKDLGVFRAFCTGLLLACRMLNTQWPEDLGAALKYDRAA